MHASQLAALNKAKTQTDLTSSGRKRYIQTTNSKRNDQENQPLHHGDGLSIITIGNKLIGVLDSQIYGIIYT